MNQLSVRDLLTRDFVGVSESDSVRGAIELMREDGDVGAVVLHGSEPVGTVAAAELLDCIVSEVDLDTTPVSKIMRPDPPTIRRDSTVAEAASLLARTGDDILLVEGEDGFVGIVGARDLATITWESTEYAEERDLIVTDSDMNQETTVDTDYSNQSICEACGSLSRELVNVNGQLLCPDCRSV